MSVVGDTLVLRLTKHKTMEALLLELIKKCPKEVRKVKIVGIENPVAREMAEWVVVQELGL